MQLSRSADDWIWQLEILVVVLQKWKMRNASCPGSVLPKNQPYLVFFGKHVCRWKWQLEPKWFCAENEKSCINNFWGALVIWKKFHWINRLFLSLKIWKILNLVFFCEYDPHGAKSRVAKAERDFCWVSQLLNGPLIFHQSYQTTFNFF